MTNIQELVQKIRGNITQGEISSLYKGLDMGQRYSLVCNKPSSGVHGLSAAIEKALEMDGIATRVLVADSYCSAFNSEHGLSENQICVIASNLEMKSKESISLGVTVKTQYFRGKKNQGLYEVKQDGDIFEICHQGGGFVFTLTAEQLSTNYYPVTLDLSLKKGTVTADFLPDDAVLSCYSNGMLWNGWGKPLFDRQSAELAVSLLSLAGDLRWEGDVIEFVNSHFEPLEPIDEENQAVFMYTPHLHIIDGVEIQLWEIGDCWTWDSVKFDSENIS